MNIIQRTRKYNECKEAPEKTSRSKSIGRGRSKSVGKIKTIFIKTEMGKSRSPGISKSEKELKGDTKKKKETRVPSGSKLRTRKSVKSGTLIDRRSKEGNFNTETEQKENMASTLDRFFKKVKQKNVKPLKKVKIESSKKVKKKSLTIKVGNDEKANLKGKILKKNKASKKSPLRFIELEGISQKKGKLKTEPKDIVKKSSLKKKEVRRFETSPRSKDIFLTHDIFKTSDACKKHKHEKKNKKKLLLTHKVDLVRPKSTTVTQRSKKLFECKKIKQKSSNSFAKSSRIFTNNKSFFTDEFRQNAAAKIQKWFREILSKKNQIKSILAFDESAILKVNSDESSDKSFSIVKENKEDPINEKSEYLNESENRADNKSGLKEPSQENLKPQTDLIPINLLENPGKPVKKEDNENYLKSIGCYISDSDSLISDFDEISSTLFKQIEGFNSGGSSIVIQTNTLIPSSSSFNFTETLNSVIENEVLSFLSIIKYAENKKYVDPSNEFILIFIKTLFKELRKIEEDIIEIVNTPAFNDPLEKLHNIEYTDLGELKKYKEIEEMIPKEICEFLQTDLSATENAPLKVYTQLVFDCINEVFNLIRPFGKEGVPDPWIDHSRYMFGEGDLARVFELSKEYLFKWANIKAGTLKDSNLNINNLEKIREQRLNLMMTCELNTEEKDWIDYNDEETQSKGDLADIILFDLFTETIQYLNELNFL